MDKLPEGEAKDKIREKIVRDGQVDSVVAPGVFGLSPDMRWRSATSDRTLAIAKDDFKKRIARWDKRKASLAKNGQRMSDEERNRYDEDFRNIKNDIESAENEDRRKYARDLANYDNERLLDTTLERRFRNAAQKQSGMTYIGGDNRELADKVIQLNRKRGNKAYIATDEPTFWETINPIKAIKRHTVKKALKEDPDNSVGMKGAVGFGANHRTNPLIVGHELRHTQQPKYSTTSSLKYIKRMIKRANDWEKGGKKGPKPIVYDGNLDSKEEYHDGEFILDHINNRYAHEKDANRQGLIDVFMAGGNSKDLENAAHDANVSQWSYDERLAGYKPQNLEWNMDAEARARMNAQLAKLHQKQ